MKQAAGEEPAPMRRMRETERGQAETREIDVTPNADAELVDVLGDNTTNAVVFVMVLLAWVAKYTVVNHCTC